MNDVGVIVSEVYSEPMLDTLPSNDSNKFVITEFELIGPDGKDTETLELVDEPLSQCNDGYQYWFMIHSSSCLDCVNVSFRVRQTKNINPPWTQFASLTFDNLTGSKLCFLPVQGIFYPDCEYTIELVAEGLVQCPELKVFARIS